MKLALITIGLLTTISQVAPAFARGGGIHSEDLWFLSTSMDCLRKFATL